MKRLFFTFCFLLHVISLSAQPGSDIKKIKTKYFEYFSFYHKNRDSIKIAVDVFLPKNLKSDEKVPTIFYLTRYVRTIELKGIVKGLQNPGFGQVGKDEVDFFTKNRYAIVIVDAIGSGASFGKRMMDFTPEEMKDGAEVMDWIVQQPWSNGKIGTTGISYLGTTSELLLMNQHPNVKACIPRSNIYDLYADISFPGGVRQGPFVKIWGITTRSLDNNNFKVFGGVAKSFVKGINPVMGDKKRLMLKAAINEHLQNYDVFNEILKIEYRDEQHPILKKPIDDFSIHNHQEKIIGSGTPIFRIGGWYDGALSNSVIKGLWNNPNTEKVLLGPWDHGPHDNASPFAKNHKVDFPIFETMLQFFDYHLKGIENSIMKEKKVQYYTIGEETWHYSDTWPPSHVYYENWFFSADTTFSFEPKNLKSGKIDLPLYYDTGSGGGSRWNSQTALYRYEKNTGYPDRKKQTEQLFHFESSPLNDTMFITGHIEAHIECSFPTEDGQLFIYVDDVAPDGTVNYITEGMFRAIHRKIEKNDSYIVPGTYHTFNQKDALPLIPGEKVRLSFTLMPISYRMLPGHQLRISITGSDPQHFDLPKLKPSSIQFFAGDGESFLMIPVENR